MNYDLFNVPSSALLLDLLKEIHAKQYMYIVQLFNIVHMTNAYIARYISSIVLRLLFVYDVLCIVQPYIVLYIVQHAVYTNIKLTKPKIYNLWNEEETKKISGEMHF